MNEFYLAVALIANPTGKFLPIRYEYRRFADAPTACHETAKATETTISRITLGDKAIETCCAYHQKVNSAFEYTLCTVKPDTFQCEAPVYVETLDCVEKRTTTYEANFK